MDEDDPVIMADNRCSITLYRPEDIGSRTIDHFEHRIDVKAGPFRGSFNGVAWANSWRRFHAELSRLYESLSGTVSLGGYENVEISVVGNGRGHMTISVRILEEAERPIRLNFVIFLDQTQLPKILGDIEHTFLRL
jgi:hypothetical protein